MNNPVVIFQGEVFYTDKCRSVAARRDVTLLEFEQMFVMNNTALRKGLKSPISKGGQEVLWQVMSARRREERYMILNKRAE